MARPRLKVPKHCRDYVVMTFDKFSGSRRYFLRNGYKSIIFQEFLSRYPDLEISIFVLSSRFIPNTK